MINISSSESRQVLNMGGPYVGNLLFNNKLIAKDCLTDDYLYVEKTQKIYFVKYHSTSNMMNGVFFTINFYSIKEDGIFEYEKQFKMLYIKRIIGNKLEIYNAFHDQIADYKTLFDLSSEHYKFVNPYL